MDVILKMDNEVPKVLTTKYFFDGMNNPRAKDDDYKLIYHIYAIAIFFSITSNKKKSTQFIRVVLDENWSDLLKEMAAKKYKEDYQNIIYNRPTKSNNTVTKTSGQYLPKHIFAIRQFILMTTDKKQLSVPDEGLLAEYLSYKSTSAEHFFCQSK